MLQASALGSRLSALGSRLSALGSRLSALGSRQKQNPTDQTVKFVLSPGPGLS
jgi:hypothetical protein